jgi:hypothetical protein
MCAAPRKSGENGLRRPARRFLSAATAPGKTSLKIRLGTLRPSVSANDAFDQPRWEMFVSTTLGLEVNVLSSLPRHQNVVVARLLL